LHHFTQRVTINHQQLKVTGDTNGQCNTRHHTSP
jgi:hypothetical protein